MAGEIARAASGITAPSQGSLIGDIADTASGFLQGIQAEKERKEKQALEDAVHALNVRSQDELERATGVLEIDRDEDRLLQQLELDEAIRAATVTEPIAQQNVDALTTQARALETGADRLVDADAQNQLEEVQATRAIQNQLIVQGVDEQTARSYNFQGATDALADVNKIKDREALNARNERDNRTLARQSLTSEMGILENRITEVERNRREIIPNLNSEMQAVIDEGFFTSWVDPETGQEVNPQTAGAERRTQIILRMTEEEKRELVNLRRSGFGLRTTQEEEAEAVAELQQLNARLLEAMNEMAELRIRAEADERPAGQDIVQGGNAGANQPGGRAEDIEIPAPSAFSPVADSLLNQTTTDIVGASNLLRAMEAAQEADPSVRHVALEDITARLQFASTTAEEIHAQADEVKAERDAAALEEQQAQESNADRRRRENTERTAAGAAGAHISPRPGEPGGGSILGPALQQLKDLTRGGLLDLSGDEEEELDPELKALAEGVQKSAGEAADRENVDTVATSVIVNKLAELEGSDSLQAAKDGFQELLALGESRRDALMAIKDIPLRIAVANQTPNRLTR